MGVVNHVSLLRSLFVIKSLSVFVTATGNRFPPSHPDPADLVKNFGGQLRCLYADLWLTKGPNQAAIELGIDKLTTDKENEEEISMHRSLQWEYPGANTNTECEIAPGPAGAAHQAAFSTGYRFECPGTPAEGSPYQWPLMWSSHVEMQSVPFESDDIVFESRGKVWYRLDKNWKRLDTTYSRGVQRAVGQGLCAPENIEGTDPVISCRRDSDLRTTMLHRQSKMYFINWKNGTAGDNVANIESCVWLDLQIVGNVRPDWFMDARGAVTDVQYLGDQHVYYEGVPKLVKQWRKKDFACQYFVMSMLGNPGADGIHWPLILNVPGEGFGDDFLQKYTNHTLLTEQDEDLFLLDQLLEAANGTCPQQERGGGDEGAGPPVGGTKIPSNLEIDPNSWCSREYTFSPVWVPPEDEKNNGTVDNSGDVNFAITEVDAGTIGSCYDKDLGVVQLQLNLKDIAVTDAKLPWMALGYRKDAECRMNPRDGSATDIILIGKNPATGLLSASKGSMSPMVRSNNPGAIGMIYPTLSALENADGYSNVVISTSDDLENTESASVTLDFSQDFDESPAAMFLMYAIGTSPQLGYHNLRQCFEITQFPECKGGNEKKEEQMQDRPQDSASSGITVSGALSIGMIASFLLIFL